MKNNDPVSELIAKYEAASLKSTNDPKLKNCGPYHNGYVKHRMACDMLELIEENNKLKQAR